MDPRPCSEILRLLASSHLLLAGALLLRHHRRDKIALAISGFLVGVVGHLLAPLLSNHGAPAIVLHPFLLAGMSVTFSFWLLAKLFFDDDSRVKKAFWLLLLALVTVYYLAWMVSSGASFSGTLLGAAPPAVWKVVPRVVSAAFVIHALWLVHAGAPSDLVELRLKLRYTFLLLVGSCILVILLGEVFLSGTALEPAGGLLEAAVIYALAFTFSVLFTSPDTRFLRRLQPKSTPVATELLERFHRSIVDEKVYRQEGLTVGALAKRLGVHEHKVRHLINSQLGFKNFNAFLHHFRVRDACEILRDPSKDQLAVAEIAFELGYQSLGPFNKAFKEITGHTPSAFRKSRGE